MEKRIITARDLEQYKNKLIQEEKSQITIQKYLRDIRCFLSYIGEEPVYKEHVIQYKQQIVEQYAPASVNSMLASLNSFFKEMGWYDCIVKALRIQRQSFRSKNRELTREEYYRLLQEAKQRNNKRMYLLMQTLCSTGIRISELRFITIESLKEGRAIVHLKGKTRQVLLPKVLIKKLIQYVKERNIKKGSIFITRHGNPMDRSNILHEMKALCENAKVDRRKVFPHNFRHLFACLYYKAAKDLSHLADLLGHSSINTTRIYTLTSVEEQQRQIEQLKLIL